MRTLTSWGLALAWIMAAAGLAAACTIPVFRYALERWDLTPYEITVFHDGPLPDDVETLREQLEAGMPKSNVTIDQVDVSKPMTPVAQKLWRRQDAIRQHAKGQHAKSLPWFVVRVANADETQPDAWAGPLTVAALRRVIDSKARQEIARRLSRGVSAVFVVLRSGQDKEDQAAERFVKTELARLTPRVTLPKQSAEGPQLLVALPLKAEFTTLAVRRDDPAEQGFVKMLLGSEANLDKVRGPIVFPVFGRGRALCSLFGDDLSADHIEAVLQFLCGECSCEVKDLNPGVDLLMAADWPALLREAEAALADADSASPRGDPPIETASSNPKETIVAATAPSVQTPASKTTTAVSSAAPAASPARTPPNSAADGSHGPTTPSGPVAERDARTPGVRWSLWLTAIGGACVLVLATGVWAFAGRKSAG